MKKIFLYLALLLCGAGVFLVGYIYAGLQFLPPHHHANFSVYIDGKKLDFSTDEFMEDVAGCSLTGKMYPEDRVHMHENDGDSIHVHAAGVSWEHFFSNIGFTVGPDFIYSSSGMLLANDTKQVRFVLNGKIVDTPMKNLINSEDTLLIDFGQSESKILLERYADIPKDAGEYNAKYDPASCGGNNENAIFVLVQNFIHSLSADHH